MTSSVSVIIPTWNRAISLERSIRSCLDQTVPVLEILVCDDGSTDNTKSLVKSFVDPRVKWCPGVRGGRPSIPRNRGIHSSKGDWIAFLDDDDEWHPDKIDRQLHRAAAAGTAAVCTNAMRRHPYAGELGPLLTDSDARFGFDDLLVSNKVICSSMLVRRVIIENSGGFPEDPQLKAMEDYALWLRVAVFTDIAFMQDRLVRYTDDPSQSLRKEPLGIHQQRRIVFSDFARWGEGSHVAASHVKKVKNVLAVERRLYWIKRLLGKSG